MKSINQYITESIEILGGNNPYKIKDVTYLKFPITYRMKLTLKQFSLYIDQLDIFNSSYDISLGNKIYSYDKFITNDLLDINSSYYPFNKLNINDSEIDLILNDKSLNFKVEKITPQGILRNLPIEQLIDMDSYLRLRKVLTNIDPKFSLWQNAIDKKNNTINKGELLIKDLLNKFSGIPEITFILSFDINYTLKLKPIYFKNKNEISRFEVDKIDSNIKLNNITDENIILLNIYDIKKEIDKFYKDKVNFNLKDLILNNKVKIKNTLIGHISQNNRSLDNFINHFKINKFNIKNEFKEKYFSILKNEKYQ